MANGTFSILAPTHQRDASYAQVATIIDRPAPIAPNEDTYTPLTDLFPETVTLRCGFTQLDAPAAGFSAPAGSVAWHGLLEVNVGDVGQEMALFALTFDAASTNHTPAVSHPAWGAKDGSKAAIVIGSRLPSVVGEWRAAPAHIVGVSQTILTNDKERYYWEGTFPSGNFNDSTVFKIRDNKSWTPYVFRVPAGTKLQVAFVWDRTQANAAAGEDDPLLGFVNLQLNVGLTRDANLYVRQR